MRRDDPRLVCPFDDRHIDDHTEQEAARCIEAALVLWPSPLQRMAPARSEET